MKRILPGLFSKQLLFVAILFSPLALKVPSGNTAVTIHEIPPLPGMESSRAYGINNSGIVCGKSFTTNNDDKAIIWSYTTGLITLPSLYGTTESSAWDINDNGQISGFSHNVNGYKRGVRWQNTLAIEDIGTLVNTQTGSMGASSEGYAINNDGTITGFAEIPNNSNTLSPFHAILFNGASLTDLGTLNTIAQESQYGYSISYNKNDNGETVGIAHNNDLKFRPFIHHIDTGMTELPIDTNHTDGEWYAVAINNSGMIVGHLITSDNKRLPYYWKDKNSLPTPIPMPPNYPNGEIYSMNAHGQVVGMMWRTEPEIVERAFIFDTVFGIRDLNDLIAHESGWTLTFARELNNNGQIVGSGKYNDQDRGYLLDSLNIFSSGDFSNDGKIDLQDVILSMQTLSTTLPVTINKHADMDGDGKVSLGDIIYLLGTISATPKS